MAKKSKKNMEETFTFSDYVNADAAKSKAQKKLDKINKFFIPSVIATLVMYAAFILADPLTSALEGSSLGEAAIGAIAGLLNTASSIMIIASFVIYAMTGAFRDLLKVANKCGKVCWFFTPFFPMDMGMYILGFAVGLCLIVLCPCLALWLCRRRIKKEVAAAEEYMRRVTPLEAA